MAVQILLGVIGISSGCIVAGGVIALIIGLGIITRYAGISHTAIHVNLYEDSILLGAVAGNLLTVYRISLQIGGIGAALMGTFFGIFVGGWILALAEIINIFPVFRRRVGIVKGIPLLVLTIAAGKIAGSLIYFYLRW